MTGRAARSPREAVVHHSSLGMFSIRDRGWKFEVEPLPKPDLWGLYVLLPAAAS